MQRYEYANTSSAVRVRRKIGDLLSRKYQQAPGFRMSSALAAAGQPVVEIAGPTEQGFPIINDKLPAPPIVTNLHTRNNPGRYAGKIDMAADARRLPFPDSTVGMVLASCVPRLDDSMLEAASRDYVTHMYFRNVVEDEYARYNGPEPSVTRQEPRTNLRLSVIEEAGRVLRNGGLLVWQGGHPGDINAAAHNGLGLMRWSEEEAYYFDGSEGVVYECVFQKGIEP